MIFERAARREFAHAAAGVSVALLAILMSTQLVRLLKDAAGGKVAPEAVLSLLGFSALNYLPSVLTLTLFVSVLLVMSRVYRDSEMAVWMSSGMPLRAWLRPVLRFSLPIVLAIGALSGFLSPWASERASEYKDKLSARNDVSQVAPGAFRETSQGRRVFFVESMAEEASRVANIFVTTMEAGKLGVVVASSGYQDYAENGDRFIVLEQGRRYDIEPGSAAYKVMDFERYRVRTEDGAPKAQDRSPSKLPLHELLKDPSRGARAEVVWRVGVPLTALVLVMLAVPLSYVNPRAGRSANLVMAILIYAIYNNLMSVSESWVALGKTSFLTGLGSVHAVMLIVTGILFWHRESLRWPWQKV